MVDETNKDLLLQLGPLALSARLKRLSDQMNAEARTLYAELELPIEPSFYLVFLCLEAHGELGVMALTKLLGWSHPSVIALVRRMTERGLVRGELSALGPADHQIEHHLPVVLTCGAGGTRGRHHPAGPGAVPDEFQLSIGEQAFVHQHPVEGGADRDHVVGE